MDGWIKQPRQEYNLHSFQELLLPLLLVLEIKLGPSGYGATSSSEPLSSHRHTTHTQVDDKVDYDLHLTQSRDPDDSYLPGRRKRNVLPSSKAVVAACQTELSKQD